MKKVWFKAKQYGYGWYPASWQGWLTIGIYLAVLAVLVFIFETNVEKFLWPYLISVFIITALLIYVSYKTGEKATWRWGGKEINIWKKK